MDSRDIFLVCTILLVVRSACTERHFKIRNYRMITEENRLETTVNVDPFCGWGNGQALNEMCSVIMNFQVFKYNRFEYQHGFSAQQVKVYKLKKSRCRRRKLALACQCPTNPPVYILNTSTLNDNVIVVTSQKGFISEKKMHKITERSSNRRKCRCCRSNCTCSGCCRPGHHGHGTSGPSGGGFSNGFLCGCICNDVCNNCSECLSNCCECLAQCCCCCCQACPDGGCPDF